MTLGARDTCDRRYIPNEIEGQRLVECCVDCVRSIDQEERIAVRRGSDGCLGADVATGARPILDDEGLAKSFRHPLSDQAREEVVRASGRATNDQA
jgi:hypothetical protein